MSKKKDLFEHHINETYCTKTKISSIWLKRYIIHILNIREFSSNFHLIFSKFTAFVFQAHKAFYLVKMSQYWVKIIS